LLSSVVSSYSSVSFNSNSFTTAFTNIISSVSNTTTSTKPVGSSLDASSKIRHHTSTDSVSNSVTASSNSVIIISTRSTSNQLSSEAFITSAPAATTVLSETSSSITSDSHSFNSSTYFISTDVISDPTSYTKVSSTILP
ncbi:hypothetical protein C6P44_002731, partial [Monosporozyma unispora]